MRCRIVLDKHGCGSRAADIWILDKAVEITMTADRRTHPVINPITRSLPQGLAIIMATITHPLLRDRA